MIDVWQYPKYASLLRSVFRLDFTKKILLKPLETKTTRNQTFETQTWTLFLFKDAGIWVFGCAIGNRFYWWSFFFNPSQIWGMVLWKCILFMYDRTSWVEITEVTKRWPTVAGDWGSFSSKFQSLRGHSKMTTPQKWHFWILPPPLSAFATIFSYHLPLCHRPKSDKSMKYILVCTRCLTSYT